MEELTRPGSPARSSGPIAREISVDRLGRHVPFDRMERSLVARAAALAKERVWDAGDALVAAGAVPEALLLVEEGELAIVGPGGEVLAKHGAGAMPGLEGLLTRRTSVVSWRAETPVRALAIGRRELLAVMGESSTLGGFFESRSRVYGDAWLRARDEEIACDDSVLRGEGAFHGRLLECASQIRRAPDVPSLVRAAREAFAFGSFLVDRAFEAVRATRLLSALSARISERAFQLAEAEQGIRAELCWLAFGSEGRREQTLHSDQDNGIIFDARGSDPEAVRAAILPLAARVNQILDECGHPRCEGGVMAGNPACCLSMEEWKGAFARWLSAPGPEEVLRATIFFDLRPTHGRRSLGLELRRWLAERASREERFLRTLASAALRRRPPGLLAGAVRGWLGLGALDLKRDVAGPFVDAARVLALAAGVRAVPTEERLRDAAPLLGLSERDVEAWAEAFRYALGLRLRQQRRLDRTVGHPGRELSPRALNPLERNMLAEVLERARSLQRALAALTGADAAAS